MVKSEGIFKNRELIGREVLLKEGSVPIISSNGYRERLFEVLTPDLDLTLFLHHVNWARANLSPDLYVFVNLKPRTLIEYTEEIIESLYGKVVIELREDVLTDAEFKSLVNIRERYMFLLSIDDFGRKASNVERIKYLHPNFVKIDMSLISDRITLLKLVDFIHSINRCHIIAEKVETERDLQTARASGIQLWQGWYEKKLFSIKEVSSGGSYDGRAAGKPWA